MYSCCQLLFYNSEKYRQISNINNQYETSLLLLILSQKYGHPQEKHIK